MAMGNCHIDDAKHGWMDATVVLMVVEGLIRSIISNLDLPNRLAN